MVSYVLRITYLLFVVQHDGVVHSLLYSSLLITINNIDCSDHFVRPNTAIPFIPTFVKPQKKRTSGFQTVNYTSSEVYKQAYRYH